MFTLPSYRVRAYLRGKHLVEQEEKLNPRRKLHLKRTSGEIHFGHGFGMDPTILPCRVVLNDFSPEGIYIFTEVSFEMDTSISLTIENPLRFYFSGHVVWCKRLSLQQSVMGSGDFGYRVAIRFDIQSEQEREELRGIYHDLLVNHLSRA